MNTFKRFILFLSVIGLLGGCNSMENKNSREWIENKIANLEKIYPTSNIYELFEKFPKGFRIVYSETIGKQDITHKELELWTTEEKTIVGRYRELIWKEGKAVSEQQTLKDIEVNVTPLGEILNSTSNEKIDFVKSGFLFQNVKINQSILRKLSSQFYDYSFDTKRYSISYSPIDDMSTSFDRQSIIDIDGNERLDKLGFNSFISIRLEDKTITERIDEQDILN
ncbi:hypothetical protein MKL26_06825 [Streptococcus suis]|nr:hypothetical protein [Streptococcus suis]